jgi:predicted PurR-regulated permease PerM
METPVDSTLTPRPLRALAALGWRLLVVGAVVVALALLLARLRLLILPVFAALLLAALLVPALQALRRRGWPRGLAAATVAIGGLVSLGGLVAAIAVPVAAELDAVDGGVRDGVERVGDWLAAGPFGLTERQVDQAIERGFDELRSHGGELAGGVLAGTTLALELLVGALLTLFLLFFFLKDGDRLWAWTVRLFPAGARGDVDEIGRRAFAVLAGYLRGVAAVALVDAVLIGSALAVLGIPLVIPLALLTFVGGFFPIVGANLAGFAAAMVALVSNGLVDALIVAAVVLAVQQLEGHLLQPLIVGRSVQLHPVAILLALTAGGILWGIAGAFLAVPLAAIAASAGSYLRGREPAHVRTAAGAAADTVSPVGLWIPADGRAHGAEPVHRRVVER